MGTAVEKIKALQIEMTVAPIHENVANSYIETIEYLQELGFRLSGMFPVTFDGNCLIEFDCVMCRQSSMPTS